MLKWLLVAVSVVLVLVGHGMLGALREEVERYEFENRTKGGTVRFESFEAAKAHEIRREQARGGFDSRGGCLRAVGVLLFLVTVVQFDFC